MCPNRQHSQSHESRVVAQLLTLMDGMENRGRAIVIGATNRPNVLDPALRRPGRFDREIFIDAPDVVSRQHILQSQTKGINIDNAEDGNLFLKKKIYVIALLNSPSFQSDFTISHHDQWIRSS